MTEVKRLWKHANWMCVCLFRSISKKHHFIWATSRRTFRVHVLNPTGSLRDSSHSNGQQEEPALFPYKTYISKHKSRTFLEDILFLRVSESSPSGSSDLCRPFISPKSAAQQASHWTNARRSPWLKLLQTVESWKKPIQKTIRKISRICGSRNHLDSSSFQVAAEAWSWGVWAMLHQVPLFPSGKGVRQKSQRRPG